MVVEDNDLVSGALRILFEETGRRVTVARSVAEAVAAAKRDRPDLLLLDLTLPDGDGLGIVRQLRAENALPRVTVALTGRDETEIKQRCEVEGCTAVLVKPVPTVELLEKVNDWLAA